MILSMALFLLTYAISFAEDPKVSPHSESGDCAICHVAPADKLRGWFVLGSTKREMKDNLNQVCLKCHPLEIAHADNFLAVGKGHAISKKPEVNLKNLPLADNGTINCATTCHNIHVTADNADLYPKRLRVPTNDLCTSCHNM